MIHHISKLSLVVDMTSKQHLDKSLMKFKEAVLGKLNETFSLEGDGILRCQGDYVLPMWMG